jgi:hypothetical protein
MTATLSLDQLRCVRLYAQRLHPKAVQTVTGVAALVRELCGLQAQEPPAAALAIRARSVGLTAADVEQARVQERSIISTWCMRGTRHLLAAEDVGWLLALFGPLFIRKSRRRHDELGLTEEIDVKAVHVIGDLLRSRGPQTRSELAKDLAKQGIPVEGQAIIHLIGRAALEGVVCFGPDRGSKPTWVALEEWVNIAQTIAPENAVSELARRYLAAYAPATPEDFAAWSGLPQADARAGFEAISDRVLEIAVEGQTYWMLKSHTERLENAAQDQPTVRLLPSFDTYLLGYRSREFCIPAQYAKRVHPGGGLIYPTVLVDGWGAATWKIKKNKKGILVVVEPFETLSAEVMRGLEDEAQDVGRFLEQEAALSIAE